MREIKFRAWYEKSQTWIYIYIGQPMTTEGRRIYEEMCLNGAEWFQYTGRKDKKSKEIFKGDILKDDCGELHEIKFGKLPLMKSGDCVCTYEAFYCKCYGKLGQAPSYDCTEIGDWMEIIGNTEENPELLNK